MSSDTSDTDRRGRGQPPVGPVVKVKMPADLITRLDQRAATEGTTRSELIRRGAELVLGTG